MSKEGFATSEYEAVGLGPPPKHYMPLEGEAPRSDGSRRGGC